MARVVRGRLGQVVRRCTQLGVVAFVLWGALDVAWRNYKVAHNHPRLVALMEGDFWGQAYALNESLLGLWGEPYRASLDFLGLPWAATVGGVRTADPLLVLGYSFHNQVLDPHLLLGLLVPFAVAFLLGKVFCSHLCPMRLAFEVGQWIGGLLYLGVPVLAWQAPARLGGFVLLGGMLATLEGARHVDLVLPAPLREPVGGALPGRHRRRGGRAARHSGPLPHGRRAPGSPASSATPCARRAGCWSRWAASRR
ncbi:MAG: 4Fe-4S binding protein [bacterium]